MTDSLSETDGLSEADRALIAPYVTNLDDGVFALRNLPDIEGESASAEWRTQRS